MTDYKNLENPVEPPLYLEDIIGAAGIFLIVLLTAFLEPILDGIKTCILT